MKRAFPLGLGLAFLASDAAAQTDPTANAWATHTTTERAPMAPDALSATLLAACGVPDQGLQTAAAELAALKAAGNEPPTPDTLQEHLHRAGSPWVWPRAWFAEAQGLTPESTTPKLIPFMGPVTPGLERRCGVGRARNAAGADVVAVLAATAHGTLKPLPLRQRTGQWVDLDATLRASSVYGARVVITGPRRKPRDLPTSVHNGQIRARFPLPEPGRFVVQVLGDFAEGPRPIFETVLFADVPPQGPAELAAPGEPLVDGANTNASDLFSALNAARTDAGVAALRRDPELDALALAHAESMRARKQVAHDVGTGSPRQRTDNAGLALREVGENVAHGKNLRLAHRALYDSPSHRLNLLRDTFRRVGIGVVRDDDGTVWACELFGSP